MSSLNMNQGALGLAAGLGRLQSLTEVATARVSSGKRIDRPSVDATGVGQAAKLDSQQDRLSAVEVNLQNGVSRMQVTSEQLRGIDRLVTRLGELATLSNNPIQNASDKAAYNAEFVQLQTQIRQTIGGTSAQIGGSDAGTPIGSFNGNPLFGPGTGETLSIGLQPEDRLTFPAFNLRTGAMGDLVRQDAAGEFTFKIDSTGVIAALSTAQDQLSSSQAVVGSVQSRLNFSAGIVTTARTNQEAALSVIRDSNIAQESTTLARLQILTESHTAMLAQARDASAKLIPLLRR